jgi:hypothetical protein
MAVSFALFTVAGVCFLILFLMVLARSAPAWWRTVNREDPAIIALGQRVENEIVNRLYKNRADNPAPAERPWRSEPWTIELRTTEANAWLSSRLPKWLANQKDNFRWPKDVSGVQVEFERSRIRVGAKVSAGSRDQVLSATLEPRLERDGRLFMPATSFNLGRLAIPADWVLDHAQKNAAQYIPRDLRTLPETQDLIAAFAGAQPARSSTLINLGDGRSVRILSLDSLDGKLRITCQTEME